MGKKFVDHREFSHSMVPLDVEMAGNLTNTFNLMFSNHALI
jgi:hypothetical protein